MIYLSNGNDCPKQHATKTISANTTELSNGCSARSAILPATLPKTLDLSGDLTNNFITYGTTRFNNTANATHDKQCKQSF
jgi:hypothetical protein